MLHWTQFTKPSHEPENIFQKAVTEKKQQQITVLSLITKRNQRE